MNRCTALRGMISGGYAIVNAAAGKLNAASNDATPIPEKAAARLVDWKAHGPVLNIPVKHDTPVGMNSPAPVEGKTGRQPIRKPNFKPHRLLDAVIEKMFLPSDTALAKTLQLDPNTIYSYRHGKTSITPRTLIRMHQASDIPMQKLYALMAEMNPPIPTVSPKKQAIKPYRRVKPHRLLDALIEKMNLRNDAALAKMLEVAPPVVSKHRSGKLPIGASMLIRMHETTDIPIRELRALMSADASGRDHGTAIAAANKTRKSKAYARTR
jgi:plasmid maintenance system antidote protein VapI